MANQKIKIFIEHLILILINVMYATIGVHLYLRGEQVLAMYKEYEIFLIGDYYKPSSALSVGGVFLCLCSLIGCIGWGWLTKVISAVANMCILLLTLLFYICYSVKSSSVPLTDLISKMVTSLENFNLDYTAKVWDSMQKKFHCCGINYPADWQRVNANMTGCLVQNNGLNFTVPYSCSKSDSESCHIFEKGCLNSLEKYFSEWSLFAYCLCALCLLQVITLLAFISIRRIHKSIDMERIQERQRLLRKYKQFAPFGTFDRKQLIDIKRPPH